MDFQQFVDDVRERAGMETERQALIAVEATLKTLGERLNEREAVLLAAHLPPEIGRFLTVVDPNKEFDLDTFYENVSQRELIDPGTARDHAHTVLAVVQDVVGPGELQDLLTELPEDFLGLFPSSRDGRWLERP